MNANSAGNYWPSHVFAVLFNNLPQQTKNIRQDTNQESPLKNISANVPLLEINDTEQARLRVVDGFNDLMVLLESLYQIYSDETQHKSAKCELYQQQAMRLLALINKKNQTTAKDDAPDDLLGHSETYLLFKILQQLKNYLFELPSGWHETVKSRMQYIVEANHCYKKMQAKKRKCVF